MTHTYSAALRRVAPVLAPHKLGYDLLRTLADWERMADEPDPDGWDTAEAVYWLSVNWHGGQWCPLYAAGCVTEFRPGACADGPEPDSTAELVLSELESWFGEVSS